MSMFPSQIFKDVEQLHSDMKTLHNKLDRMIELMETLVVLYRNSVSPSVTYIEDDQIKDKVLHGKD